MSNWKKNKLGLFRVNIYIYIYDPLDRLFIFLFVRMEHKTIIVLFSNDGFSFSILVNLIGRKNIVNKNISSRRTTKEYN
jgi:hypothetical protein